MNWEQKLDALNAISRCCLMMRKPGDWYVSQRAELKDGSVLIGAFGNGATPEEAVDDHWREMTCGKNIVVNAGTEDRKEYLWNGFMWREV